MLPTSGTYNFQSIQVELLIREAYERIGISGDFLDTLKMESARRSINFLLLDWMNKTVNLWTLQNTFLSLIPGRFKYDLPENLQDIVQLNLRTSSRQSFLQSGTPQSNTGNTYDGLGGGTAADAFDGNEATACIQTAADGNISYDFGLNNQRTVTFVGIESNVTRDYILTIERCPTDPTNLASWEPFIIIPEQTYVAGNIIWIEVLDPVPARAYRIREVGTETLNIREIYFNNNVLDYALSNVSRYEYNTYPNKYLQSRPTVYYVDRQVVPVLYLWPAPTVQYNCITYSYKRMMEDTGLYTETIDIPAKMYPALVWGLSYHLALKFNPSMVEMLENKYDRSFHEARIEGTEDYILSIKGENM